jgi:Ca2+-binding RTX toxin-like protein
VTEDQDSTTILTGNINNPNLTIGALDTKNRTYKFTGNIDKQAVEFSVAKDKVEAKYTGVISLAGLLKTVGVTADTDIASFKGTITDPSLTIGNLNTGNRSYKFSGEFNGKPVEFDIQKDKIILSYKGSLSLAEVLTEAGIRVDNIAILNNSISGASLTISNFSSKNTSYKLTGNSSEKPIVLDFSKEQIKITYQGETSLVDLLKGVPSVETIAKALSVPLTSPSFGIGKLDTPSKTYEISGRANFNKSTEGIGKFINDKLGIQELELITKVDSNGASLKGIFGTTDILLFGDKNSPKDFSATLTGAALGLAVTNGKPSFGIDGKILLKNYDFSQENEPELTLAGTLNLDTTSLTASFQLGSNTAWKNPFGLGNSELRKLSFQLGGSYVVPYIDNIALLADMKVGGLDVKSALFIAPKEPGRFGMELTVNEPIGLVDILSVPLSVAKVDNSFVATTKDFLKKVLDVTIVSIRDPDKGPNLAPLIKFAPLETKFANTTLPQGIAVNGKINLWGKEASISLAANPFSSDPSLSATLKLPEIDLGFLKITSGKNSTGKDSTFGVDLKVNLKDQSLKADAGLELFGRKVANLDLSLSPKEIILKNFQLGWQGVLEINLENFTLNPSTLSGSAKGGIKLFGKDLATASFSLNNGNLSIAGKLEVEILGSKQGIEIGLTLGKENRIRMDATFLDKSYNIVDLSVDPFVNKFKDLSSLTTVVKDQLVGAVGDVVGYAKDLLNDGLAGLSKVGSYVVDAASDLYKSAENFVRGLGRSNSVKFIGGDGNDGKDGNDNNDVLFGNGGDDVLHGRLRSDVIDGGTGNDELYGGNDPDTISGGDGNDSIYGQGHSDLLYGGAGNDYIEGEGDDNQLDWGNDTIYGGLGNDTVRGGDAKDHIEGNGGDDQLYGEGGEDYVAGQEGNDKLYGSDGNDTLVGGDGNDELHGWTENDKLFGDAGNDTIYGQQQDDELHGYVGNDLLFGDDGNDTLYGQDDNDTLSGGSGSNVLNGGTGSDWADYSSLSSGGVRVKLELQSILSFRSTTILAIFSSGSDSLIDIENVIGSSGDDQITGDSKNNIISGGKGGNDSLSGNDGDDSLYGGVDGNDSLYGGRGNDTLNGGPGSGVDFLDGGDGSDFADYSYTTDDIQASLFGQKITFSRASREEQLVSIENVIGGSGNDRFEGTVENNIFLGKAGNDTLSGNSGDDSLYGGDGNDFLNGGSGYDLLDGGSGNDTVDYSFWNGGIVANLAQEKVTFPGDSREEKLVSIEEILGSTGNDSITGDAQSNRFMGGFGNDSLFGEDGNDFIYGEAGNDLISGGNGEDSLVGMEGNDDIAGNAGNDDIRGDEGDDKLSGDGGNDQIRGDIAILNDFLDLEQS